MKVSDQLKDMLTEIFHIGVGRAAASLADLLNYKVDLNIPNLYFFNQELLDEYRQQSQSEAVCVIQKILGEMRGLGVLSLPMEEGKTLVDSILNTSSDSRDFEAVEIEAIQEIGNIVINAIGGAFGNILGLKLIFEPPSVAFMDHLIPSDIMMGSDNYFFTIASTSLGVSEINVEGMIILTFAYSNIEILERFIEVKDNLSKKFGEILLNEGHITEEQLEAAITLQSKSRKFIGQLMVDEGIITSKQRDDVLLNQKYKDSKQKFGELVLNENLISSKQLEELLDIQKHSNSLLGEILTAMDIIDDKIKQKTIIIQKLRKNLC